MEIRSTREFESVLARCIASLDEMLTQDPPATAAERRLSREETRLFHELLARMQDELRENRVPPMNRRHSFIWRVILDWADFRTQEPLLLDLLAVDQYYRKKLEPS
jgi:hypothetical protein